MSDQYVAKWAVRELLAKVKAKKGHVTVVFTKRTDGSERKMEISYNVRLKTRNKGGRYDASTYNLETVVESLRESGRFAGFQWRSVPLDAVKKLVYGRLEITPDNPTDVRSVTVVEAS